MMGIEIEGGITVETTTSIDSRRDRIIQTEEGYSADSCGVGTGIQRQIMIFGRQR